MASEYQAFPILGDSFAAIATAESTTTAAGRKYEILHATANDTITFVFASGNVAVPVTAGDDLVIGGHCTAVTSTAVIWMS